MIPWSAPDPPTETALQAALARAGFEAFAWTDTPDVRYGPHSHDHDECICLVSGKILFGANGRDFSLRPGDRLILPKGTLHTARVGSHGATYLIGERR